MLSVYIYVCVMLYGWKLWTPMLLVEECCGTATATVEAMEYVEPTELHGTTKSESGGSLVTNLGATLWCNTYEQCLAQLGEVLSSVRCQTYCSAGNCAQLTLAAS